MKNKAFFTSFLAVLFFTNIAFAWTLPVRGDYRVTNGFWDCARYCYHLGDDVVAAADEEVLSIGTGEVVEVTYSANCGNYGGRVLIQYATENGAVVVLYGHLGPDTDDPATDDIFVSVGDWVIEGQSIGRAGTQNENGCFVPHLHIGIHRGPYLGYAIECVNWTYAGYTAQAYDPSDACYCSVLDNWYDPSEFLGITPKDLHIVEGSVTPGEGTNETQFTWNLAAETGLGAPITAGVFIWNPVYQREYFFLTPYIGGTARPFRFAYSGQLVSTGEYAYRFQVRTCADSVEDEVRRNGPVVRARERQQDPPQESPPPTPPPPPEPPQEPRCEPRREICDGQDNDCDTWIDEDEFNEVLTRTCSTNCGTGVHVCDLGHWLPCTAPQPQEEVCDNRDNDCDHFTDENLRQSCGTVCGPGNEQCRNGEWIWCTAPQPREETCNYRDDDCDGERDEGLSCQYWQQAEDPPPQQSPPPQEQQPPQQSQQQEQPQEQTESQPANPPQQENPQQEQAQQQPEQQQPQQQAPPENPQQQPPQQQPAETPLSAPTLNNPPDGFVREVPAGANWSISISWNYVSGGVEYEYEIRSTATGIVEESGRIGGSFHNFYRPPSAYGERYSWKVRAISASGLAGAWSETRTFMFRAVQ